MGDRHVSVSIKAPPETVFGLYTDPGRARDWQSGVREVRTAGPPDQPGSRAVIAYRWPFKMTAEVLQGPIGRVFDARVGDEMVATVGGDLARLKALAEEQAGPRRA
jgi:Polyketide cyclase / dehydrase and lipid transport